MPAPSPSERLNAVTLRRNIPVSITIELTRRCPLKCLHCYLPETRGRSGPARELAAPRWEKILRELAGAGGLYLVFTGGEPLLRPDLAGLCAFSKGLGFDVRVFSTGLGLTAARAWEFKKAGVSAFELSFYGRPRVHEAVTGVKGSFSASLAAARTLKKAGISVKLKVPLMKTNSGQAGWLEALAAAEGFGISFDPVIAPANDGNRDALKYRLSGRALAAAVGSVARRFSDARLSPAADVQLTVPGRPARGLVPELLCGAGRNVCAVGPGGELYPCLQLPVELGRLGARKLSGIWRNSAWLKEWRRAGRKDLKDCAACPDGAFCSSCPGISLLEEGDVFAPNRPACEMARLMRFNGRPRK